MFGLQHCVYFRCLVNGSNHLAEADRRPLHLCPVCLRKLQWSVGFDVENRYRDLKAFHDRSGIEEESLWLERRLRSLAAGETTTRTQKR
jgi:archaemetzincin